MLTLASELVLPLLVRRRESETLTVLLGVGADLTLYIEDAGLFVIDGRKLPRTRCLTSICLMAISRDFFESVLPKPKLSGDEDFPDKLLCGECLPSCLGDTSFLIFTTLSTVLVPTKTGLTLSLALAYERLTAGRELPLLRIIPLGGRLREGEHDCRLTLP